MKSSRKQTRDAEVSIFKRLESRSANGRTKKVEQYYSHVRWTDAAGTPHEMKRRATSHTDAVELRRELLTEVAPLRSACREVGGRSPRVRVGADTKKGDSPESP